VSTGGLDVGVPVRDALEGAVGAIEAAGCETPRLDAETLLAHALGVSRERLLIERELVVRGPAVRVFQDAVRRRAGDREPVAYIVGRRGFRRLEISVDHRALIPRPETELLVEIGMRLGRGARVLDLGTGSGAVALALKDERTDLDLAGSDADERALEVARLNGRRLGLEVRWMHANLLAGVPEEFDALLSNPPYVAEPKRRELAPEILRHEPPGALFAGPDGLVTIRALLEQVCERRDLELVAIEVGVGQALTVAELIGAAGFSGVRAERDLAGIERVVVGER
jgi:release factor glutamine methyltransferase